MVDLKFIYNSSFFFFSSCFHFPNSPFLSSYIGWSLSISIVDFKFTCSIGVPLCSKGHFKYVPFLCYESFRGGGCGQLKVSLMFTP
jgi:hypothetical protein